MPRRYYLLLIPWLTTFFFAAYHPWDLRWLTYALATQAWALLVVGWLLPAQDTEQETA